MRTALLTAIAIVHSSRAFGDEPVFDSPGAGYREQAQRIDRNLPRLRIVARKSTEHASGLLKGNVTPDAIAKTYRGSLTRVTDKPKSIGPEFATLCSDRPAVAKYGPHVHAAVHYYRSESAKTPEGNFAPGSVLVKEKLVSDEGTKAPVVELVTGMIKQPAGASPKTGDWQFFVVRDGKVETAKMEGCAGCHSGAKRDYVFTDMPKR